MCVCGKYNDHNEKAYSDFISLDLTKIVVYPDPNRQLIEIYENFTDKRIILHACPSDHIEQVHAIQKLEPKTLLKILHKQNRITLQASYENWNYVLSCVAIDVEQ